MSERLIRSIQNSKGNSVSSGSTKGTMSHAPSRANMSEGEEVYALLPNGTLSLYKKINGLLFRSDFSYNGNENIEGKLIVRDLEYRNSFIDYRVFMHNFEDDIGTTKHYMPWWGTTESSSGMDDHRVGFVTPFRMTLHKVLIRAANGTASDDVTIRVEKQDDGDQTEDIVATAVYDVSAVGNLANHTVFTLNQTDFDNSPTVEAGKLCGLSIQATGDIVGSNNDWYISSVWRVEVEIT